MKLRDILIDDIPGVANKDNPLGLHRHCNMIWSAGLIQFGRREIFPSLVRINLFTIHL